MFPYTPVKSNTMWPFTSILLIVVGTFCHRLGLGGVHAQSFVTISTTSGDLRGVEQDGGTYAGPHLFCFLLDANSELSYIVQRRCTGWLYLNHQLSNSYAALL